MRAYRNADTVQGTQVVTPTEFAAITAANRSSSVLYVVGIPHETMTANLVISDVWVGNTPQQFLVDNMNTLVWVSTSAASSGFTTPPNGTPVINLV